MSQRSMVAVNVARASPSRAEPRSKQTTEDPRDGARWGKPVVAVGTSPVRVFAARAKSRGIRSSLFPSTDSDDTGIEGSDSLDPNSAGRLNENSTGSSRKAGFRWDTEDTLGSDMMDDATGMSIMPSIAVPEILTRVQTVIHYNTEASVFGEDEAVDTVSSLEVSSFRRPKHGSRGKSRSEPSGGGDATESETAVMQAEVRHFCQVQDQY
jgi:hypothetical protein